MLQDDPKLMDPGETAHIWVRLFGMGEGLVSIK